MGSVINAKNSRMAALERSGFFGEGWRNTRSGPPLRSGPQTSAWVCTGQSAHFEAALVTQLARQRLQQRRLAGRWRAQQQRRAPGLDDAADVVQDRHLALLRPQQARLDECVLQRKR